jgi:hypothetical protein
LGLIWRLFADTRTEMKWIKIDGNVIAIDNESLAHIFAELSKQQLQRRRECN